MPARRVHSTLRDLHLYAGLFLAPFFVIFALSTLALNHPSSSATTDAPALKRTLAVAVPEGAGSLEQAKQVLRQLGLTGEIDYVRYNAKAAHLVIPVSKPGETTLVDVDLRQGIASVETQSRGLGHALNYLHKMPGPHNASIRGNWRYLGWWRVTADAVVYGLLFVTVSGVYLWWFIKADRVIGSVLLAAGALSVAVLIAAIVTA